MSMKSAARAEAERYRKHNIMLRDAAAAIAYNLRVLNDAVGPGGKSPLPPVLKRYIDAAIRWSENSGSLNPTPHSVYELLLECAALLREHQPDARILGVLERIDKVTFPTPRVWKQT